MGGVRVGRFLRRLLPSALALVMASLLLATSKPGAVIADPLPATPVLYVAPNCLGTDSPTNITVHGRNFTPNQAFDLQDQQYTASATTVDADTQVTPDAYGFFTATLTITRGLYGNDVVALYSGTENIITQAYVSQTCYAQAVAVTNCSNDTNPSIHVTGTRWTATKTAIHIALQFSGDQVGNATSVPGATSFDTTWSPGVTLSPGQYTIHVQQIDQLGTYNSDDRPFMVPCPTMTVTPNCAQPGAPPDQSSFMVSGTGFIPNFGGGEENDFSIVFDHVSEPQEFFAGPGSLNTDGSFGPVEIRPFARANGSYSIRVNQRSSDGVIDEQVETTVKVPCFTPKVAITPNCGPPAILGDIPRTYSLTVSGSGFEPQGKLDILFDALSAVGASFPPSSFPPSDYSGEVGADGTFAQPIDPAYRPPGTHRIAVTEYSSVGPLVVSVSFDVPCSPPAPTLSLDPPCGPEAAGQPAAYDIKISGTGFAPGPVDLVFDPTGTPESAPPAAADDTGNLTAEIVANGRPPSVYQVVATQATVAGPFDQATATFAVNCHGLTLKITPTSGARGFVPLVEGFGFPANSTVLLRWDFGIGAKAPISVTTDANGRFSKQLLIFEHDFLGLRHLTVEAPNNPTAFPGAQASYLVSAGTIAPPFVVDNPFGPPDPIVLRR